MTETINRVPFTSINKWFMIPFFVWVIFGGIAQLFYNNQILFALFNTHHTAGVDHLMIYITKMGEGVFGAIILLLLFALKPFRNWWYFAAAILCNMLPAFFTQWLKDVVHMPRPLRYFHEAPWIHTLPQWERLYERSFPSGHTCAAFSLFCFLAFVLTPKYKWAGVFFFLLAISVAYSRMYLAAHFFADVYWGSIIGVVFSILVMSLMRKYSKYFFRMGQKAKL